MCPKVTQCKKSQYLNTRSLTQNPVSAPPATPPPGHEVLGILKTGSLRKLSQMLSTTSVSPFVRGVTPSFSCFFSFLLQTFSSPRHPWTFGNITPISAFICLWSSSASSLYVRVFTWWSPACVLSLIHI